MELVQCLHNMFFTFNRSSMCSMIQEFVKGQLSFKSQKMTTNWMNLWFLFVTIPTQINSSTMFWSMFNFHILAFCWHEIVAQNTSRACNLAFLPTCMFLQVVKLMHQKIFPTFDLITHFAMKHSQFPITPYHYLNPCQFCNPHLLENTIQFPFLFLQFF
jgi:hypothetical protein